MRYRIGLILLVLLVGLAACSALGVQQSTYNPWGCDKYNGVCIKIKADKEIVEVGEAVPITITVTSEQDQSDLSLQVLVGYNETFGGKVFFPGQDVIEEGSYWQVFEFDIEKDQPRIFRGTISFSPEQTRVPVTAVVFRVKGGELRVTDFLDVYFTENGGQVYYSGTKIPTRDVTDIVLDNYPVLTYTPGPSPTWAPSATWPAYIATREARTQQAEPKTPPTVGTMMVTQIVPSSPP